MRIVRVSSTQTFTGSAARPLQVVRVHLANDGPAMVTDLAAEVTVEVAGAGVSTGLPGLLTGLEPGAERVAEVGVAVSGGFAAGTGRPVMVAVRGPRQVTETAATITVAEPGWTMWMVSHFHYDPVWWGTQRQYTESWQMLPRADGTLPDQRTAFELVRRHLDKARTDPDYKFVLAEIDYLKPHFDAHPEDRADLLHLIKAGRIEIVGGSYNEPNTNLTGAELTIRNAAVGLAFQRELLGADPATAWMLDAFGFDPAYPGVMAAAGLAESAWARGPFHQWGPSRSAGSNELMQFPSEFEWLSPSGAGLLTSYMPNHYGAGWSTHQAADLAGAERAAYQQFRELSAVAVSRNVLLPVGADHVIPSRWVTAIHRDWNARYVWPRFVTAVPSEYFAAVRAGASAEGAWIMPQTRDMNPVYTGKDVSYTDTKQANRAAEVAVLDAERLATAAWLAGADYPAASLDKAWRLLVFGAHHDAITGTESDQVYLDLLAGWREAYDRGDQARSAAAAYLAGLADTASLAARLAAPPGAEPAPAGELPAPAAASQPVAAAVPVMVLNTLSAPRSGLARCTLEFAAPGPVSVRLRDDSGTGVPVLADPVGRHPDGSLAHATLTFRADDVPGVGMRCYLAVPAAAAEAPQDAAAAGWRMVPGQQIENDALLVAAEPGRAALSRIFAKRLGAELLAGPGNELVLAEEYPAHPKWGEGPWLLSPTGAARSSVAEAADVRAERCPIGSRLVASFSMDGLAVTQETLLWDGAEQVEFRTHVDGSIGQDRLLRARFAANVPGGLPVYQSALSVLGRPPGPARTDVARDAYTMDCPAHEWFGVGATVSVRLAGDAGDPARRAIGVAEVIAPAEQPAANFAPRDPGAGCEARPQIRDLLIALARQGVTATCSVPDGPRYGWLEVDSNLPDARISLGGPEQNRFTAEVLQAAGPAAASALASQLAAAGRARLWVPAAKARAEAFSAGADLRGTLDLPVLIVAGDDLPAAIGDLAADLADAVIEVGADGNLDDGTEAGLAPYSVAVLNRGTPSSLVTPEGELYVSLMRACSSWPAGVWIDGDRRPMPDGSSFGWQHWSHTFEYALAAGPGDWRAAGFPAAGQRYAHDLRTVLTGLHRGPLPPTVSFATVEPASAALMTLKPRGNPLVPVGQPDRQAGVTVRLRHLAGTAAPVQARVRLLAPLVHASVTSLLEDSTEHPAACRDGAAFLDVPPAGTVTAALMPEQPPAQPDGPRPGAEPSPGGPDPGTRTGLPEPVQPVFTRYWLHGKGPAPAGNLAAAVHLSPGLVALAPGDGTVIRMTVAAGACPGSGEVVLDVPAGLRVSPAGPLRYELPSLGFLAWDLAVTADAGASPGRRFLAARIADPAGQLLEDVSTLAVGEPGQAPRDLPLDELLPLLDAERLAAIAESELVPVTGNLILAPGGSGAIAVRLDNHAASEMRGEAQLISPIGSWESVTPASQGFTAPAGGSATITFPVRVPRDARPGQRWWALAKVMYFGRLHYSEPVSIDIAAERPLAPG